MQRTKKNKIAVPPPDEIGKWFAADDVNWSITVDLTKVDTDTEVTETIRTVENCLSSIKRTFQERWGIKVTSKRIR